MSERPSKPRPHGMKLRNIRVPEELWKLAQRRATELDTTISAEIRQFLAEWTAK